MKFDFWFSTFQYCVPYFNLTLRINLNLNLSFGAATARENPYTIPILRYLPKYYIPTEY